MKHSKYENKGVAKGAPSGVLLSVALHLGLAVLATILVVFHDTKKPETKFVPPAPIDRPKMKLQKPRVKMKTTAKPRAAKRITVKGAPTMPAVQLPDISGVGTGLSGGVGGYELVPDVSEIGVFGGTKSISAGNSFEGTLYVLNRARDGSDLGEFDQQRELPKVARFIENDWGTYAFAPYYRSPKKLYATQFLVPIVPAVYGPRAFGVECDSSKSYPSWVVHYKGKISSKKGGRYRFWGSSSQVLLVRVKDQLVLNASYSVYQRRLSSWKPTDNAHLKKYRIGNMASIGHWFELEKDEVVEMEVLIGNLTPPRCGMFLVIEDEEEQPYYSQKKLDGAPILPVFRTAEMSEALKEELMYNVYREDVDFEGGEIFNVH